MTLTALVTGGAGFVGCHLAKELLLSGWGVILVDNFHTGSENNVDWIVESVDARRLEVVRCDVQNIDPSDSRFDIVYHLACPASPPKYQASPSSTIETAFLGTRSALEVARRWKCPIVIASTSEVYGSPEVPQQPESYWGNVNPFGPRACYDEGKRAAEALAWCYMTEHGVDVRIARIFNTYGPRMDPMDGRFISNFFRQALLGKPMTIYGDGSQTRSPCYVDDMVSGLRMLGGLAGATGVYNIGNPDEHTVKDVALMIAKVVGSSAGIVSMPLPVDDPPRRRPDIRKFQNLTGWIPRVSLREGLLSSLDYFKDVC